MTIPNSPAGTDRYPSVFRPVRIGNVDVRNRIFIPAHTTNYGEDHMPSEKHVAYHRARARGGVGLIIFESIRVHRSSLGKPQGIAGYDRRCIDPFRRVADAVHEHGAKLFGQIIHLGRQIDGDAVRASPWGASPIPWSATAPVPHMMNDDDISNLIAGHVASAKNVLEAGFDGIEVHLGHGHLLQQFLSPLSNNRTDAYGGSEGNRVRLALEVLAAVRAAVGPEACVGIRVSADEYVPGGLTIDDMERIVPSILDRVPLDFVNVSHSAYHGSYSLATQIADMSFPEAPFRDLVRRMTRAVRRHNHTIPIMAVCRFRTIAEADAVLRRGDADLVGMARAHIAEPDLVVKSIEHSSPARPCIGCNQGCTGFLAKGLPITCVVNPTAGRETEWSPDPQDDQAPEPRRVLVVGAGPAGLEAAWVAAARGHRVRVWDRASIPGGRLNLLRHMPLRHDFLGLVDYQVTACLHHGVELEMGLEADARSVTASGADAVVLALGAEETPVGFPDGGSGLTLSRALQRSWELGPRVALYDTTGSWSSVSVAEHLARVGKHVTLFAPAAAFAWQVTPYSRTAVTERLRRLGVRVSLLSRIRSFDEGRLAVEDLSTGEIVTTDGFDSIVAAGPPCSRTNLRQGLAGAGIAVIGAGDCVAPRSALEAVFEGHAAGRAL